MITVEEMIAVVENYIYEKKKSKGAYRITIPPFLYTIILK
jgi:hypothetical protein